MLGLSESQLTQPLLLASLAYAICASRCRACSVCWLPWETKESILSASPYLEEADIDEALSYAPCLLEDETIELRR